MQTIVLAEKSDLPEILALQYLAFQSVAELHDDFDIQPLRQTLLEVEAEFERGIFLKALSASGEIIGSVRGYAEAETFYIGKLMVRPQIQRQGLGSALLLKIESLSPVPRLELFTSSKLAKNLELYEKQGYARFREEEIKPGLKLVYLEKFK